MTKEFIPYQQALALKEIGFDESCFGWYDKNDQEYLNNGYCKNSEEWLNGLHCSAPLYQQAFRWFREKYGLYNYIRQYYGEKFYFHIEDMVFPRRYEEYPIEKIRNFGEQYSQEKAELECLKKLIEIVKTNLEVTK